MSLKTQLPQSKIILDSSFSLALPVAVALIWSFLVRNMEIFGSFDVLSKNLIISGIISLISLLFLSFRFRLVLTLESVLFFIVSLALITLINWHVISESIACDELYHAGMSSLAARTVQKFSLTTAAGQFWGTRPMPESVALLSIIFSSVVILVTYCWNLALKKIVSPKNQRHFIFIGIWIIGAAIGQMCRTLPERAEIHPPFRLFPLFVSQTIFGYDDLSFRLPGLVLLAMVATSIFSFIKSRGVGDLPSRKRMAVGAGLLVCVIPTVAHSATIVEPSIWCFGTWVLSFLCVDKYLRENDARFLVATSVLVGIGSLMRQNAIVLWPALGIVLLIKRPKLEILAKALMPGLFVLPYLWNVAHGQHSAASTANWKNIVASLDEGAGFLYIVKASTAPWIVLALVLLLLLMIKKWWKTAPGVVILLSLIPAYLMYFSLGDFFWSFGRYQAEYIGSSTAILITCAAIHFSTRHLKWLLAPSVILCLYSIGVLRTLHYDSNYNLWSRKRITTESLYPYREALGFLNRQNTSGQFVFVGGTPVYGEWLFYLRGFTFADMEQFRKRQHEFEKAMETTTTVEQLSQVIKKLDIHYVVLQWGDRREMQHRAQWQNSTEALLKLADRDPRANITLEDRFYGNIEGSIDIYKIGI